MSRLASVGRGMEAGLLLAGFSALVRWAPPALLGRVVSRFQAPRQSERRELQLARHIADSVERAATKIPGTTCLSRALTGTVMLRRRRVDATLRLGVAAGRKSFLAHAWVEHAGHRVIGADEAEDAVPLGR